jgi:hypothetical protein
MGGLGSASAIVWIPAVLDDAAEALRANEDVRQFHLGVARANQRSFKTHEAPQALAGLRQDRR